jgi:asparagine synthase (glutamine-hydrolysing)
MAHGVEIRMPFLDWRIVCFAFGLPAESKLGGGFTKRVVREGMKGVMPEALRVRKQKIGFSPPMADWFNAALGDWVWDQVHTDSFIASEVWDGPAIRDFVEPRHRTRTWTDRSADQVWPFLQAHLWRQTFLERPHTQPL